MSAKKRPLASIAKLSRREQRIAGLVANGLKNQEIATELGISVVAIRNYLTAIYNELGVSNRVELALWYWARKQKGSPIM